MSYIKYPSNIPLSTELGTVYLSITDANHTYVHTDDGYTLNLCFVDNKWIEEQAQCVRGYFVPIISSKAQIEKIRKVLIPVVIKFMDEHPELRRQAQIAHVHNQIEIKQESIKSLKEEIRGIEMEIEDLEKTI